MSPKPSAFVSVHPSITDINRLVYVVSLDVSIIMGETETGRASWFWQKPWQTNCHVCVWAWVCVCVEEDKTRGSQRKGWLGQCLCVLVGGFCWGTSTVMRVETGFRVVKGVCVCFAKLCESQCESVHRWQTKGPSRSVYGCGMLHHNECVTWKCSDCVCVCVCVWMDEYLSTKQIQRYPLDCSERLRTLFFYSMKKQGLTLCGSPEVSLTFNNRELI